MTCQLADALIEDVLNGEAEAEGELGLREHLRHCDACAEAWHVAWQVRQTMARCEVPDPGESYFRQATASILSRIRATGPSAAADGSPEVVSARSGPLQIRGVGLTLLMALSFLAPAFRPAVASPVPLLPHPPMIGAVEVTEAPRTAAQLGDRAVGANHRRPFLQRLSNALGLDLAPPLPRPLARLAPSEPLPLTT
ncbi:MAG: zf-HC2 domain-containing protein [Armatimonadetes bacterium]|nr:zf-HC2 domain-containing protein [Armatimonadota bacterium]